MDLYTSLSRLCRAPGPSGFIGQVTAVAEELLLHLVDEVPRDKLNNLLGLRHCGRPGARLVLLDAHLDEIGFVVTGHEDGFLRFTTLGGVDPRMLPGRELTLMTPTSGFGVIAAKAPHVLAAGEQDKSISMDDLRIEVGLTQEEAVAAYPVGTTAVYREGCARLAGERVAGKAMDDRACYCLLLRTLELLEREELKVDLCVLGSNQEETDGNGALAAAYALDPFCAVAVDVTFATQSDVAKDKGVPLGGGPVLGVGPNMARWMTRRFEEAARAEEIPYHLEISTGHSGTNGWEIQTAREGIATQVLSVPLRYMHTPMEVVDLRDIEQGARLLAAFLRTLGEEGETC